jgi:hypothetical protein
MTLHQPILMQPASGDPSLVTTGQEFRQMIRHLLNVVDVGGAQGVIAANSMQVTQRGAGANLSVDISNGGAFVVGDDITNQGTYHCWNDATVNVAGLTVPGAGTFHHRIILQIEDHLANSGAWTAGTYTAVFLALLDTGGGLPAEPNSAITLATIDIPSGSPSVTNSMINDFRVIVGQQLVAVKAADTTRASTTALADDPDLQLLNLSNSARYQIEVALWETGASSGGDLKYTFRTSAGSSGNYSVRQESTGGNFQSVNDTWTGTNVSNTDGSNLKANIFQGQFATGSSRPAFLVLQWAQNSSDPSGTVMKTGSYMTAQRLA